MLRNRIACAALLVLTCVGVGRVLASGPVFDDALFTDRTAFLLRDPVQGIRRLDIAPASDGLKAREDSADLTDAEALRRARLDVDSAGLPPAQQAAIHAMRDTSAAEAWQAGAALPAALRLYTAGAVAFAAADMEGAQARFAAILRLDPQTAAPRVVWAAYMLGRIAASRGDTAQAEMDFAKTRAFALGGAPDPQGLAVASWGEQARLHLRRGDMLGAIALYRAQAAHRSDQAVNSLAACARAVLDAPQSWPVLLQDGPARDVMIRYAVLSSRDDDTRRDMKPFFDAVAASVRPSDPADALAALAYHVGDYGQARSFAERSDAPFALWLRAKLALRDGHEAEAGTLFDQALRASRATPQALGSDGSRALAVQVGAARVRHGDYVLAFRTLWPQVADGGGDYVGDVLYLGERILTDDELKRFVDEAAGPQAVTDAVDHMAWKMSAVMRDLLARRLVRDGRIDEALPYFVSSKTKGEVMQYRDAMGEAKSSSGLARAAASWRVATLLRWSGMELMGTELDPDVAQTNGLLAFSWYGAAPPFRTKPGEAQPQERLRYVQSAPIPDARFHYRYLAMAHADEALAGLSPRSQAAAAILCQEAAWMARSGDDLTVRRLWRRYVRTGAAMPFAAHFGKACPAPDIAGAAGTRRRLVVIAVRDFVHRHKLVVVGSAGVIVSLAGWTYRRRKKVGGDVPSPPNPPSII